MGRPLRFDYHVQLGPRGDGYPIRAQRCRPAADDNGHTYMCRYIEQRRPPDVADRPGHAARRRAAATRSSAGTAGVVGRLLLRRREPRCTSGAWCSRRFTTRSPSAATGERMKTPLLDIVRTRPLLGDGAMGTQLMLAGLEQGGCGEAWNLTHPDKVLGIQRRYAEAGSRLHPHQHVRRVADHAEPPRPRRRRRRGQQGRGRDRARGVRRQARLRARRHRPVRRADGAVRRLHRGAGARRVQRAGPGPRRRRRRRDHHRDADLARGAAARRSRPPRPPARRASSARWRTT